MQANLHRRIGIGRRPVIIVIALVALGAGGYAISRAFRKEAPPPVVVVPNTAQPRQSVPVPPIPFTDVTKSAGIAFTHQSGNSGVKLLPETMGGGVAVLDYDGDGKPDILFINSGWWPGELSKAPAPTLALYRNKGDGTFEDVTSDTGLGAPMYGMGVAVGDFDNDGRPDVFVSCVGRHHLFRNVDGKRFMDVTAEAGVGGAGEIPMVSRDEFLKWKPPIPFGSSATFVDYDNDGRLDLFVCHYVTWSPAIDLSISSTQEGLSRSFNRPQQFEGAQATLYRNVDGKRFEDVSSTAGVQVFQQEGTSATDRKRAAGKCLGVIVCDPDEDGWPDLLVANDSVRNFFFSNQPGPNGTRVFKEIGESRGAAYADEGRPRAGMGIDWGEFASRRPAVVVTNFATEPLTFLEVTKSKDNKPLFADSAVTVGLSYPSRAALKFGTVFMDADNDGRLDLLVCNGHIEPEIAKIQATQQHAQPAQLYWNTGNKACFYEPVTAAQAGEDLFKPMVGRGCAYLDYDGDGDLDVILVANGGPARLLRNDSPKDNHSLRLDLRGNGKTGNRSAIGATVEVEANGQVIRRMVTGARGYLSQSELIVHVGLGKADHADKVMVRWPGQSAAKTWENLSAGRVHVLTQE
ncbi:CRTAC1 family protein [Zavarzinella formosa]|uniref:CRTAC1 family protein n=1 Tax=Zavarzinella formosa TaxID=360055 RepID=UPI0002EF947E|nr:CRTAC1 family protein [Zavarzinella formosa]